MHEIHAVLLSVFRVLVAESISFSSSLFCRPLNSELSTWHFCFAKERVKKVPGDYGPTLEQSIDTHQVVPGFDDLVAHVE